MTKDELVAQTHQLFKAWNSHDADAVARFYTGAATVRDSTDPNSAATGTDAIVERARMILGGFSDARLELLTTCIEGNRGCTEWRFTGTHDGEFLGVPASGRPVDNIGVNVDEFDDSGKIVNETGYWDVARFLRQSGTLPEAATTGAIS
ncbi:MAG TPA: ester cyclase [Mycobacterium sp.]|uniref:ester cyclase n=1 Tax=Mycobacterium sp. TaxID=1785 RepID=UPI002D6BE639|nr:ester cyclase [Mycobacterium sp.]HZU49984.1 ester cyclase [Mycobacterium sp.]